jgi:hypothetical protein
MFTNENFLSPMGTTRATSRRRLYLSILSSSSKTGGAKPEIWRRRVKEMNMDLDLVRGGATGLNPHVPKLTRM